MARIFVGGRTYVRGMGSSAVADREAMLAALAQIETLTAQMNRLSIDAFTDVELLDVQQRLEAIARAQPVLDHRVYQRITSQSSPISLGAKNYSAVLSQRLRISSSEARRRLDEAALLGPRTSLTGEPLAPSMPTFARGQAQGLIGAERIKHVRWFFRELPGFVDFQTRENAEVQLAQHACELGPAEFRTAAAHMLYLLNQDGELSDEDRQALAYIRVGKQRPDGMRPFEGLLTPEAWATLEPLMERNAAPGMCNPADEHPCLDGEPTDEQIRNDTRTTGKRNHDALLALCKRMLTTQPTGTINGLPANVVITVSLTDLEKGTGHGLTAGEQTHHQPVGLGEHIAVGVAQLGVDERLTAVGLPDPAARGQRGVDGRDLAVVDVQEGGAADRPARGVDHHAEHRIEQQRHHGEVRQPETHRIHPSRRLPRHPALRAQTPPR